MPLACAAVTHEFCSSRARQGNIDEERRLLESISNHVVAARDMAPRKEMAL